MPAEISFDLVMSDDMEFVEGTYRLPGRDWAVFIFSMLTGEPEEPEVTASRWRSGVSGVFVRWPKSRKLNRDGVLSVLSRHLGVTEWVEVRGPDSMQLR